MKRRQPIALKLNDRVIAWSSDYKRYLAVVVTRNNTNTFQGETIGENPEKVNKLSKYCAWTLKEFEKKEPEEFYRLFPNKKPAEESVNSLQPESSNQVITEVSNQVNNAAMQQGEIEESWNPEYFGDLEFTPEEDGQLNLLNVVTVEPPDPDDFINERGFRDLEAYNKAWDEWKAANRKVKEEADEEADEIDDNGNTINGHLPPVPELPPHDFNVGDRVVWEGGEFTISQVTKQAINLFDGELSVWVTAENFGELSPGPGEEIPEGYLPLASIEVLSEMQPRYFGLNDATIENYMEMLEHSDPPPVTVYKIEERLVLTAGFHRIEASRRANRQNIPASIVVGTWEDALIDAAKSNAYNGLQMNHNDKSKAIEMYLIAIDSLTKSDNELHRNDPRKNYSLRKIAAEVGASHTQVANIKHRLEFRLKAKEFGIEYQSRWKHKELGSLGTAAVISEYAQTIQLEWDVCNGDRYSGAMSIEEFIKDFEPTNLPKTVNTLQIVSDDEDDDFDFDSVEDETKAKGRSLGLPTSRNGVLPECKDNGNGNCLQVDRTTPPEMEPPTPEQCYEVKQERIVINPDDLVIGILSNVNQLKADHIRSLFDAIAHRIPDELLIEEAQKRSAVSSAA